MSISHFTVFLIFGIFIKNQYFLMLIIGILWEILEIIVVNTDATRHFMDKYWPVPERYWDESCMNKYTDLVVNLIGYHVGNVYIRHQNIRANRRR